MSKEQPQPHNAFEFTERERLHYRVSDERLRELLDDARTTLHSIELDANTYGEFLFLTLSLPQQASQPVGERSSAVTFFGLGFHEYRERWITSEWFWYEAFSRPELLEQVVDRTTAQQRLEERQAHIRPYVSSQRQSRRGQWFEMMADLTDEDAAYADYEELADWLDEQ